MWRHFGNYMKLIHPTIDYIERVCSNLKVYLSKPSPTAWVHTGACLTCGICGGLPHVRESANFQKQSRRFSANSWCFKCFFFHSLLLGLSASCFQDFQRTYVPRYRSGTDFLELQYYSWVSWQPSLEC